MTEGLPRWQRGCPSVRAHAHPSDGFSCSLTWWSISCPLCYFKPLPAHRALTDTHQCAFCCASASGTAWSISCCSQGRHTWRDASRSSHSPTARWWEPHRAHAAHPARTERPAEATWVCSALASHSQVTQPPAPSTKRYSDRSYWKQGILLRSTSTTLVWLNRFFAGLELSEGEAQWTLLSELSQCLYVKLNGPHSDLR